MAHSARSIINGKKSSNGQTRFYVPPPSSAKLPPSLASKSLVSKKEQKPSQPRANFAFSATATTFDVDEPITWKPASEFLKSENGLTNGSNENEPAMRREPSYIRLSRVLNGYINNNGYAQYARSKTPDPNATRRSYESPLNRKVLANGSTPKYAGKMLVNGKELIPSVGASPMDPRLENCSSYCFKLPDFEMDSSNTDGEGYKKLVEEVLSLLKSHLEKTTTLLQNQNLLPEEVSESVRVAVGRTELLLKKRMAQFTKQLHSHLNPVSTENEKVTTLNDLHGLWTLVDIQLADIRNCFDQVEKSRLIKWQTPRQTLTTASSMPSLLIRPATRPSTENNNKKLPLSKTNGVESTEAKEKEMQRKAAMDAKRQELNRQRKALIDAKRAEMNGQKAEEPKD